MCLAIAAWNAVHLLTLRAIITPLLTGNTVVLKTSEITPGSQALWAELLYEAGVPRTALSVVHAAPDEAPGLTEQLISDRRVRHVNFTGSTRVGRIVASLAGQGLKPCIMELGGKAPVLLLPDADIETAASHILMGAFFNQGQVCMSTERVLVPESRFSELVTALQKAWGEVQDKTPKAPFKPDAVARMRDLVDDAVSKGAQMLLPLEEASEGTFPHQILGPATQDMRIWSEETFGPLAIVIPVPDDGAIDTMVDIANESEYGLTASVWGKDLKQAEAVARRLQSGAVHINSPVSTPLAVPKVMKAICAVRSAANIRPRMTPRLSPTEAGSRPASADSTPSTAFAGSPRPAASRCRRAAARCPSTCSVCSQRPLIPL